MAEVTGQNSDSHQLEDLLRRDWSDVICFSCGKMGNAATRCLDFNESFPFSAARMAEGKDAGGFHYDTSAGGNGPPAGGKRRLIREGGGGLPLGAAGNCFPVMFPTAPVPSANGPQLGSWWVAVVRVEETPAGDASGPECPCAEPNRQRPIDLPEVAGNVRRPPPPPPSWFSELCWPRWPVSTR